MNVNRRKIQANHNSIEYTYLKSNSRTICFMFSGSGYNYDKPLFYYATMTMLQNKIDIVHMHYAYEKDLLSKPLEEITRTMIDDINPVISDVLKNNQYDEVIFLGKSLGTIPIVNDLMKREGFFTATVILLTPLLNFDSILDSIVNSRHRGLLVIGDKDHFYNPDQVDHLGISKLQIELVQNANHSLDIGQYETTNSILALSKVMGKIQETIDGITK
ncbi:alpha/beta family hydrolase [Terribacillus saccharophilus]|uniref:alpha/beta family hydrolase n=1 Tax=Terribacillus saccharophilus TaxID=361277 RepID=UPI003982714D